MRKLSSQICDFVRQVAGVVTSREKARRALSISLYRNAVYLMIGAAVMSILGFAFWILAARLYTVETVGLSSAALSAINLIALLSSLGLDLAVIRFLPEAKRNANIMINSCLTITGLASVVFALIFLAGLNIWSPNLVFLRHSPSIFCAFILFTLAAAITYPAKGTFIAERRNSFNLINVTINSSLKLALVVLLVTLSSTFGIIASWGIGMIISVLCCIFLFLPRAQIGYRPAFAISRKVINEMAHFSFANYGAILIWLSPSLILPLIVLNVLGAESNAYFYIAWTIGVMLLGGSDAISQSLFAEGSYSQSELSLNMKRSLKFVALFLIPAILVVFFAGDKILLLFGKDYSESATWLLRILAISTIPVSLNWLYFSLKRIERRMKGVIGLSTFVAITTLALSWVLLPQMGILGAGLAWFLGQVIAAIFAVSVIVREVFMT